MITHGGAGKWASLGRTCAGRGMILLYEVRKNGGSAAGTIERRRKESEEENVWEEREDNL